MKIGRQEVRSDNFVIACLREVKKGVHPQDVALKYGTTYSSVVGWCKKAGVTFKRKTRLNRDWANIISAL